MIVVGNLRRIIKLFVSNTLWFLSICDAFNYKFLSGIYLQQNELTDWNFVVLLRRVYLVHAIGWLGQRGEDSWSMFVGYHQFVFPNAATIEISQWLDSIFEMLDVKETDTHTIFGFTIQILLVVGSVGENLWLTEPSFLGLVVNILSACVPSWLNRKFLCHVRIALGLSGLLFLGQRV